MRYLPEPEERTSPYAALLLAGELADLPPAALVITAGFDVLRDEGEAYARKLEDSGTTTGVIRYPGMIHGFVNADRLLPQARHDIDKIGGAIRRVFAEGNAEKRELSAERPNCHEYPRHFLPCSQKDSA